MTDPRSGDGAAAAGLEDVVSELRATRWATAVLDGDDRLYWVSDEFRYFLRETDDAARSARISRPAAARAAAVFRRLGGHPQQRQDRPPPRSAAARCPGIATPRTAPR